MMGPKILLQGHDTIECSYYLAPLPHCILSFEQLAVEQENLRQSKKRQHKAIKLGSEEFLLARRGTSNGFPFLIENKSFSIELGEFNYPNFRVTYRSFALWQFGAARIHQRFLDWAASIGFTTIQPETLGRVDFTFDYELEHIDFDEENFVSLNSKDRKYRSNQQPQTFVFGEGDVVIRVYNKVAEIHESSHKTWFFDMWGCSENVWRIEWQIRKDRLRTVGIRTFTDLLERQGDLLRPLATKHTTLRIKTKDTNRSRWPIHPLWANLQALINKMESLGVIREIDPVHILDEREARVIISVYGYLKRIGAIQGVRLENPEITFNKALTYLRLKLTTVHDELTWKNDVRHRYDEMRLGPW